MKQPDFNILSRITFLKYTPGARPSQHRPRLCLWIALLLCLQGQLLAQVPSLTLTASSNSVCSGSNFTLTASGASTYTWQPGNIGGSAAVYSETTVGLKTYTVSGSNAQGAIGTQTISITVVAPPSPATITVSSASLCAGDSATLKASFTTALSGSFGTQANTNAAASMDYPAPYSALWGGQRMQMLVLASELRAAGFGTGYMLNSIQFPVVSLGFYWSTTLKDLRDFKISIGATTSSSISAFQSGLTTVYNAPSFRPAVGYNNTHTFNVPYFWDGVSNLIIETTFSTFYMTGASDQSVIQNSSPTSFQSCIGYYANYQSSGTIASATQVTSQYNARPDFRLNGQGLLSWQPNTGLSNSNQPSAFASPTVTTTYSLIAANGVCSTPSNTLTVAVRQDARPIVSATANTSTLCLGSSVNLSASGANSYTWQPGGATSSTLSILPANIGWNTYTVLGTASNGCRNAATLSYRAMDKPSFDVFNVSVPTDFCSGYGLCLPTPNFSTNGSDVISKAWYLNGAAISNTTTLSASDNGNTISYQVSNACGTSTNTPVTIKVFASPPAPTATNSIQCGLGIPTASVSGASSADAYRWYSASSGGTLLQTGGATYTSPINASTTFYVSQKNLTCESARVAVTASVTPADPIVAASSASVLCATSSASLSVSKTGTSNAYTYTWAASPSVGSGLPASTSGPSITIAPTLLGNYSYTVTAVDGACVATSTISVILLAPPAAATISPSSANICVGDSVTLNTGSVQTFDGGSKADDNTIRLYPAPYTGYYGGQRMQMLILASELKLAGFGTGSTLNSIQFPVIALGPNWGSITKELKDFKTSIGTTTASTISSFQTGLTTVYGPTSFTPAVGYTNTQTFNSRFTWDGVSNIIIETTFSSGLKGSANDAVTQYISPTGFQSCLVAAADNVLSSDMANTTSVKWAISARPDFRLNGQFILSWQPNTSLSNSNQSTTIASPLVTTTYSLVASNGGCSTASGPVTVTVRQGTRPTILATASASTLCLGGTVALSASGATSYTWQPGGATSNTLSITPTKVGLNTYTVQGTTNNGCRNAATVMYQAADKPVISPITAPAVLCTGGMLTTPGLTDNGSAIGTQGWYLNGAASSGILSTADNGKTLNYQATNACGTSTSNTISLSINPAPTPILQASASSTLICVGNSAVLTVNGNAASYTWTPGGASTTSLSVSPTTTTTYTVVGSNSLSCTSSSTVLVTVSPCTGIEEAQVSNSIKVFPNPSTGQITLAIEGMNISASKLHLKIYEPNGQVVFQQELHELTTAIALEQLANGLYFLEVSSEQQLALRQKLMIER